MNRTRTALAAATLAVAGLISAAQPAAATSHNTPLRTGDAPGEHVTWNIATGYQDWGTKAFYGEAYVNTTEYLARGNDTYYFWRFYNAAGTVRCAFGSYTHPEVHHDLQNGDYYAHTCGYSDVVKIRIGIDIGFDGADWYEVIKAESRA